MTRLSLPVRLMLLGVGSILALAAVLFGAISQLTRSAIDRQISQDLNATTALFGQKLEEQKAEMLGHLGLFVDLPNVRALASGAGHDEATVADFMVSYQGRLGADGLLYTDPEGQLIAHVGSGSGDSTALASFVMTPTDQADSDIVTDGENAYIAVSQPVFTNSYLRGTVTALRNIDEQVAQNLYESLSTHVAIVQGSEVLASSFASPTLKISERAHEVSVDGKNYVVQRAMLPGSTGEHEVGFMVFSDKAAIVAPYRRLLWTFALVLALATVAASLVSYKLANTITVPLARVVGAADALRQGHWPERFVVTRKDEIGVLEKTFNKMADALEDHERKLLAMIDLDPLTELPNHRCFKESAEELLVRARSSNQELAVMIIDLDGFTEFNRENGHKRGDEALIEFSENLRDLAPDGSVVSRYGGNSFALAVPECNKELGRELACAALSAISSAPYDLTCSVGVATLAPGTDSVDGLAIAAELALSRAKQLGGNQFSVFDNVSGGDSITDPSKLGEYLEDGSLATIQALAAAVDAKDPYTQGHSQRVAEYARDLCRYAGGSQEEVELVYRTGTLHDVGKIGVPDSILKKTDRLDDSEFEVMKTHPAMGEMIVRKVPQLADCLPGVRSHHERWDGGGYPDGLAGEECPRTARILAIADTFDAMTSDRPYRAGMDSTVALEEIASQAGRQFDPQLARLFVEMMSAEKRKAA